MKEQNERLNAAGRETCGVHSHVDDWISTISISADAEKAKKHWDETGKSLNEKGPGCSRDVHTNAVGLHFQSKLMNIVVWPGSDSRLRQAMYALLMDVQKSPKKNLKAARGKSLKRVQYYPLHQLFSGIITIHSKIASRGLWKSSPWKHTLFSTR